MAPSLGRFQYVDKMASRDAPIEVSDEEEDQLVGARPQNPEEARSYHEKVNAVFKTFGELLTGDVKDALKKMVTSLKKVMVKHWGGIAEADVSNMVKTNDGTAKEACTLFNVSPKSLSHIMLGKRYAGGKCKRSHTAACEGNMAGEDTKPPTKK